MARGKKTSIHDKAKIIEYSKSFHNIPLLSREEMNTIQIKRNWNLLMLCNDKMKEYISSLQLDEMTNSDYSNLQKIKIQSLEMLNILCNETSKEIKPRLRFKILKRDKFTCQYCGMKAPDVILHIDHIKPFSKGGLTTEHNLITSCKDCNLGKSNIH